jgi:uncharacterized membrane protein YbhN (UPF0104 family)
MALVAAVSFYVLLPSLAAVFSSWHSLSQLTWYWAGAALGAESASFVSLWQLDRLALKTRGWLPVATAQLSGGAVGRVLPGGGATATAFTVALLRRAGLDSADATAGLGASMALQIATSLALPLFALPAILAGAPIPHSLAASADLGAAVVVLLLVGGAIAFTTDRPLLLTGRALQCLLNATLRRRHKLTGLPEDLIAERDFIRSALRGHWKSALLAAVGSAALDYVALLCTLRAVGANPRPALIVLAYTSARLLSLLPFTPGGLGFVEAGLVGTLTLAGVAPQDAVVATFAYRLISFWLPIPAGAIAYALFRRRYG